MSEFRLRDLEEFFGYVQGLTTAIEGHSLSLDPNAQALIEGVSEDVHEVRSHTERMADALEGIADSLAKLADKHGSDYVP